eukprot:g11626.t1
MIRGALIPTLTARTLVQASGEPFSDGEGQEVKPVLSVALNFRVPILPEEPPPAPSVADMISRRPVTEKVRGAVEARQGFIEAVRDCVEGATSSNTGRPERLVEIRIKEALMKQVTEYARKSLKVDPTESDAFVSQVFAELASQVVPDTLRSLGVCAEEAPGVRHALAEVHNQRQVVTRSRRLLNEAELCGNLKTAANFWQQLLAIEETKSDPLSWLEYGKFLQRVGGKAEAAEFAVRQAVKLCTGSGGGITTSSSSSTRDVSAGGGGAGSSSAGVVLVGTSAASSSTGGIMMTSGANANIEREAKVMLAALLIDRRRFAEAERLLKQLSEINRADQMVNFLRGLCVYLHKNDVEGGQNWLVLANKPKEWFRGLNSEAKMMEKLQLFLSAGDAMSTVTGTGTHISSQTTGTFGATSSIASADHRSVTPKPSLEQSNPLVLCLEKLVNFGCAKLVFTVLDKQELSNVVGYGHDGIPEILEAECYMLQHNLVAAKKVLEKCHFSDPGVECARCRICGEALFRLGQFENALLLLAAAAESTAFQPEVFTTVFVRLGHCYLLQNEYEHAKNVFLQSVRVESTAEAWVGLAFSCYRQDQVNEAYECLREALWLDDERADVWSFLTLVHLRLSNLLQADDCFRHTLYYTSETMSDELLLEVGVEFLKSEEHESGPYRAECAARTALALRETGQAHEILADALSVQEQYEKAVLEYGIAIRLFYDQPEHRANLVAKALQITDNVLHDAPLAESVHIAEKMAAAHAAEKAGGVGGEN